MSGASAQMSTNQAMLQVRVLLEGQEKEWDEATTRRWHDDKAI